MSYRIIKCWLSRHHWLLIVDQPTTLYADNLEVKDSLLFYQCQVCGKWLRQSLTNLDNAPSTEYQDKEPLQEDSK